LDGSALLAKYKDVVTALKAGQSISKAAKIGDHDDLNRSACGGFVEGGRRTIVNF